jgi:hypothetical protein
MTPRNVGKKKWDQKIPGKKIDRKIGDRKIGRISIVCTERTTTGGAGITGISQIEQ